MNITVVIPPWGSLPVYTHAPRWPEPRKLPLPPRTLAIQTALNAWGDRPLGEQAELAARLERTLKTATWSES